MSSCKPLSSAFIQLKSANPDMKPFPNPFDRNDEDGGGGGKRPYTLVELDLINIMGEIKNNKPGWFRKINDPDIVRKWRKELEDVVDHPSHVDYVLAELQELSKTSNEYCSPSGVDGVYQSDAIIGPDLQRELLDGLAPLENVDDDKKDWHPGSNGQVLDLVHPSLYPYVAGLSREVQAEGASWSNFIGGGTVTTRAIGEAPKVTRSFYWRIEEGEGAYRDSSQRFQWLPSEVDVDKDGTAKIVSYINNLHPDTHASLYKSLEKTLTKFIPLFNAVLTDLRFDRPRRHDQDMSADALYPKDWDSGDDEIDDERWDDWYEHRVPNVNKEVQYTPTIPTPGEQEHEVVDLKGRRLQVIFKMANIVLTPENPTYPGGAWHVEGMRNEHIVASGIYYCKSDNISESKLAFRTDVCEPHYEQSDDSGVMAVYGLANEGPLVQNVGSAVCVEGRALCWPNTLQHQVQPFELEDSTKPGVRKIIVMFLVDPSVRVLSTSIVPPQQLSWMQQEMKKNQPLGGGMPGHVQSLIVENNWDFTWKKALEIRQELMDERKYFVVQNTRERFERVFSLCEH